MLKRLLLLLTLLPFLTVAQAVDFTLNDIDGKPVSLSDYRGKWVVVNYWATWCPPCLEEIPELVHFHDNHKDTDGVVLGVNMEQKDLQALKGFVEDNLMSYPVLPMSDDMVTIGNIPGLPTSYLIDPSGQAVAMQVGAITAEMIESFIAQHALAPAQ